MKNLTRKSTTIRLTVVIVLIWSWTVCSQSVYFIKGHSLNRKQLELGLEEYFNLNKSAYPFVKQVHTLSYLNKNTGDKLFTIELPDSITINEVQSFRKILSDVEYIEPNKVYRINFIPNDSLYSEQWALRRIGAQGAWDITSGNRDIIIGLIDTGVDYLHPELDGQLFINPFEDLNNNNRLDSTDFDGIDNDGNGFIDDISGFDFTDKSPKTVVNSSKNDFFDWDGDPMDENGHGTFVGGIISAKTNNNQGIAGIAPGCRLLNLRAFDVNGYGEEDDVVSAILFAINSGARIINMSFGDVVYSKVMRDIINYAQERGVILVASAGNSASSQPHYPSSFPSVISVGNSNSNDLIAASSNFGPTIDISAPGTNIVSLGLSGTYSIKSGTSASAPFISAAAALIQSENQSLSNDEVEQILKSTADDIESAGWDDKSGAGRLNLSKAVQSSFGAIINFNSPKNEFATSGGFIPVNITSLHPKFKSSEIILESLQNGERKIIYQSSSQIADSVVYTIAVNDYNDGDYLLILNVTLNDGTMLTEHVSFEIDRTPPEIGAVKIYPQYSGISTSLFTELISDDMSTSSIFFRIAGTLDFSTRSMDNEQRGVGLFARHHFTTFKIEEFGTNLECYIEVENKAGHLSRFPTSGFFDVSLPTPYKNIEFSVKPFKMPNGRLFEKSISLDNVNEFFFQNQSDLQGSSTIVYKFDGTIITAIDSINNKIVKSIGDFNNNGLVDLLCLFGRNAYILEQENPGAARFIVKFSDESGRIWPVLASNIDSDPLTELISIQNDSVVVISEVSDDLVELTPELEIRNFSQHSTISEHGQSFNSPNALITDLDSDGFNEMLISDYEGDILSVEFKDGTFHENGVISTGIMGENRLTTGDIDGDGKTELLILSHRSGTISEPSYFQMKVFENTNGQVTALDSIYFSEQPTIQSALQFNNKNFAISTAQIDSHGGEEILINIFPDSYIFTISGGHLEIIFHSAVTKVGVNSSFGSIFANQFGTEKNISVAVPGDDGIQFINFGGVRESGFIAINDIYSVDSTTVLLKFDGSISKSYIFGGKSETSQTLIDSTKANTITISNLQENTDYYFSARSNTNYVIIQSNIYSRKVFTHTPGKILNAVTENSQSIKISTSLPLSADVQPEAFVLNGSLHPNSVAKINNSSYILFIPTTLSSGEQELTFLNLRDYYNSPITPDTLNFAFEQVSEADKFFISSFDLTNSKSIFIKFNLPVDLSSTLDLNNYIFNTANEVVRISSGNSENEIILFVKNPLSGVGHETTISLKNIRSKSGFVIEENAGSIITISGSAANLEDVYVFPNPYRMRNNSSITFANLPRNTEITIFNLSGKQIYKTGSVNSAGGFVWDGLTTEGNYLDSGIYIYKISMFDELGDETASKLGKFAVIK